MSKYRERQNMTKSQRAILELQSQNGNYPKEINQITRSSWDNRNFYDEEAKSALIHNTWHKAASYN